MTAFMGRTCCIGRSTSSLSSIVVAPSIAARAGESSRRRRSGRSCLQGTRPLILGNVEHVPRRAVLSLCFINYGNRNLVHSVGRE